MEEFFSERRGYGKFNFVLGHGTNGTAGHVELVLYTLPQPGHVLVEWSVKGSNFAADARERVEKAATSYLQDYLTSHAELGLKAVIVEVTSDESRTNEYERAVSWAMHFALEEAGLSVPPIYAAPDEDDSWKDPS